MKKEFDLGKVNTIQVGKKILILGLSVAIPLFLGIAIYNYNLNVMLIAISIMAITAYIMNKFSTKNMKIEIDQPNISVFFNNELDLNTDMLNLNFIRTLYKSPKAGEIQGELFFNNQKYSISALGNPEGKVAWENFYETLEKDYHFIKEKVAFSILTHNLQGVEYLEFRNPKYNKQ